MTGQILFKFKFDHTNRVNSLQGEDHMEEVKNDIIDHTKDSSHEELRKKFKELEWKETKESPLRLLDDIFQTSDAKVYGVWHI